MMLFIRLDMKGHWRGREHRSSQLGLGDEFPGLWENGVSCYSLDDPAWALDRLRWYWYTVAMIRDDDLDRFQITIFRGKKVGEGSDGEDLATVDETIAEMPADVLADINDLYWAHYWNEIAEQEYFQRLNELFQSIMKGVRI